MCLLKKLPGHSDALSQLATRLGAAAALPAQKTCDGEPEPHRGSARRRLWDLGPGAACPVSGVCLRFSEVKKLARRVGIEALGPTEYDWHVAVVAECRRRSPLSELVQRELDGRYSLHLLQSKQFKDGAALAAWWDQACRGSDWAGVFWAVLTHPRCSPELEQVVLGQVHMLQHQVGMAARVDLSKFQALQEENRQMALALAGAQQKLHTAVREAVLRQEVLESDLLRCRADLIREKTAHAQTQQAWTAWQAEAPERLTRQQVLEENRWLWTENQRLRQALVVTENAAPAGVCSAAQPPRTPQTSRQHTSQAHTESAPEARLSVQDKAVLCVGGRPAGVPVYRTVVEDQGGRFMHHDGGLEDKVGQLGALLQSADLVVCQVGCVSHNAYWRVKAHCKRHDKPCLFVETPSRAAIEKALQTLKPSASADECAPVAPNHEPGLDRPDPCPP